MGYRKYEMMLYEVKQTLSQRPPIPEQPVYVKCPWCGSRMLKSADNCRYCGGALEV